MSGVKILVVCHKNTALLKSKILLPIQVGTALGKEKLENMLCLLYTSDAADEGLV